MISFKITTAALVLSAFAAAPASAWQAIDEPGAYSFYHPGADVLNVGPSPSIPTSNAMASMLRNDAVVGSRMSAHPRRGTGAVKRY